MATVLRVGLYRFFFYSNEGSELPHIHVEAVAGLSPVRVLPSVISIVLFLGMWVLYDVIGLGQVSGLVAAVAVVVIAGVIATTVPYWNRVLAYARREDAPNEQYRT